MRAVTITEFGGPDVLAEVELPTPRPGPGQVTIDVSHAAVGLVDIFFRHGDLAGAPGDLGRKPPFVPGLEVVGAVREVGAGVTTLRVGEPVVTLTRIGQGGYATVAVVDAALTISLEGTGADPVQAVAAMPNAATAHLSLTRVAHL